MQIFVFFIGIITWTMTEYLLHRFLGHVHKGRNFFKAEHIQHHSKANYFAPAYKKAITAILVSALLFIVICLFTSCAAAFAFIVGFTGMYGLYELTHFRYHSKEPIARAFIILRKHHFYHHFHNPKMNHGVTTRFWDRVFGTFQEVEKVTVPKKMSMPWLVSEQEIKSSYRGHFQFSC